jgi:hypothetical protein
MSSFNNKLAGKKVVVIGGSSGYSLHRFLTDLGLALVLQRHLLSRAVTSLSFPPPLKNYTMQSHVFNRDRWSS